MMQRRAFVAGMAAVMVGPTVSDAQRPGKVYRLGLLAEVSAISEIEGPIPKAITIRELLARLRELGHRYGDNLITEPRSAEGKLERFPELASELVRANTDVIVVTSNRGALAAQQATSTVPIVMAGVSDPVNFGLVTTLAHPGGNITGVTLDTGPDLAAKRLELLRELSPNLRRVAYFIPTPVWLERTGGKAVLAAAAALRVTLVPIVVTSLEELNKSSVVLQSPRADALLVEGYIFIWTQRRAFADFALGHRLPAMFANREIAEAGGLIAHATDFNAVYRRAADYVDRILRGAKPAQLPVEQPSTFHLTINLKTARALGLTISPSLLLRADQVIE
jgi:putative ABC transport system substrate-binding protein